MPEGGIVTVNAKNEANFKIIRVTDSGVGMSDDVLKRIFEPFYTTRREGTGLGLAIVRKIVEQHGGSIAVTSNPGHGTCFTLTWPLAGN